MVKHVKEVVVLEGGIAKLHFKKHSSCIKMVNSSFKMYLIQIFLIKQLQPYVLYTMTVNGINNIMFAAASKVFCLTLNTIYSHECCYFEKRTYLS